MPYSSLASPTATLAVLARHGLRTKKSLGQHLLVDDNVVGRIMQLADVGAEDVVLEVGPGIGTLTVALCDAARAVVAIERDADLLPALEDSTSSCVTRPAVVRADAVSVDPALIAEPFGAPDLFVANLPYGVAATVVLRFFEALPSIRSAIVMVQAEVADRMAAVPGTKDYGAYTVKLGLHARATGRFPVSRNSFLPPPRVDSTVIRLDRADRGLEEPLIHAAASAANAAFAQRRKTLRNSLRSALGAPADLLDAALSAAGTDGSRRAETLTVDEFLVLGAALREVGILD